MPYGYRYSAIQKLPRTLYVGGIQGVNDPLFLGYYSRHQAAVVCEGEGVNVIILDNILRQIASTCLLVRKKKAGLLNYKFAPCSK